MKLAKLANLIQDVPGVHSSVDVGELEVRAVHEDSRRVGPGDLFVAVRGRTADGHEHAKEAAAKGAVAVVAERAIQGLTIPVVVVPDSAAALGWLCAARRGHPSQSLDLVGITGTNGKTTCSYILEAILREANHEPAILGTVSYRWRDVVRNAPYTTPPAPLLSETLSDALSDGCTHAILEVSSAALDMQRLAGTEFRVAAFTNLTQDHLDLHGSMDAYSAAKKRLFRDHLRQDGTAVVFMDNPAAREMVDAADPKRVLQVSLETNGTADIRATRCKSTIDGIEVDLETPAGALRLVCPRLIGMYNIANVAVAAGMATALDVSPEHIRSAVAGLAGVPGRLEQVENDAGLHVLVDYAHTPDALENVLAALRPLTRGRLICVFGCGGDRDPEKRPLMGKAVADGADLAIVTSDNPRTEDPIDIIEQILPGVATPFFTDTDRRVAIRAAIHEATPNDVVLIAGKGHEDYQIIGTESHHFDDRIEAAAAVLERPSYRVADLARAGGASIGSGGDLQVSRLSIDSRTVAPGDMYVAIVGENLDGHDFCEDAVRKGAHALVVSSERKGEFEALGTAMVTADDPRAAFGRMAGHHRNAWKGQLVAITGSSGKTTTKELAAAALSADGRVHKSVGSLNNETGVPLTLLGLRPYHDYGVVEMGMRGPGQIDTLCEFTEPDVGVVVNAGVAHIGLLGSKEAIAAAKSEVFRPGKIAIFPAEDERLSQFATQASKTITFGRKEGADVRVKSCEAVGAKGLALAFDIRGQHIETHLRMVGEHNATNAACALAVALACGVDPAVAATGLARARPPAMRGQLEEVAGRSILLDCYNANPDSMEVALRTLSALQPEGRAVAVIGDMLELGDETTSAHEEAGRLAQSLGLRVIALGEQANHVVAGAGPGAQTAESPDAAAKVALDVSTPGDWILLKASRGMRLERVLTAMKRLDTK